MNDWEYLFEDTAEECTNVECRVEGAIPFDLEGAYVANGAGQLTVGDTKVNAFDAHARVASFRISNAKASFSAKHVDTPLRRAELAEKRMMKRRIFTNKPKRWSNLFDVDLGNNAIHNVYPWAGALVAGQEPGHYLLDPETLETRGRAPVGGAEKKGVNLSPMPRFDPKTTRLLTYKHSPGLKDSIVMEELDAAWNVAASRAFTLPRGAMFLHDLAFTDSYYVMIQWSTLSLPAALWGAGPVSTATRFDPDHTPLLILLPRDGKSTPKFIPIPGKLIFHIFNAFDDGENLVVDAIGYDALVDFGVFHRSHEVPKGHVSHRACPLRLRVNLATENVERTLVGEASCEAPEVNHAFHGSRTRYGYAVTQTERGGEFDSNAYPWFRGLAKIDFEKNSVETWSAGAHAFCSPPSFAQRHGAEGFARRVETDFEDDGYLLSWIQEVGESGCGPSYLAIFDARAISKGPIAKAFVDVYRGFVSHAEFAPPHYFATKRT